MSRRHLIIPDTQVKKGVPTDHFNWIAQACIEYKPDVIVHLGDHWDMPSLSQWDSPGSKAMEGARYDDDVRAGNDAFRLLDTPIKAEIARLKRNKKQQWNPELRFLFGNHECLDDKTEALTKDGWKTYSNIHKGDFVYSLNINTNEGEWKEVVAVHAHEYSGYLLAEESYGVSLRVTPNHRVLFKSPATKYGSVFRYKEASKTPSTLKIPVSALCKTEDNHAFTDEQILLCGWLCTDSFYARNTVTLFQRESNAHKIERLLLRQSIPFKKTTRKRNITSVCGVALKAPCQPSVEFSIKKEHIGHLPVSCNLKVPEFVHSLSTRQFDIFISAVVDADGSIPTKAKTSRVVYGKLAFCESLQTAAIKHGWSASLTQYREGQWRVNLCKRTAIKKERFLEQSIEYKGIVWCLTVKDNENFMVRRNHKCCFTGNSRIERAVAKEPKLEGVLSLEHLDTRGWQRHPYLEVVRVDGLACSHFFQSSHSAYAIGGSIDNRLNKIGESFVQGHVQGFMYGNRMFPTGRTKHGLVCGSCYLHEEFYRGPQGNQHWNGIVILNEVNDGDYCIMPLTLDYLKRKYGG